MNCRLKSMTWMARENLTRKSLIRSMSNTLKSMRILLVWLVVWKKLEAPRTKKRKRTTLFSMKLRRNTMPRLMNWRNQRRKWEMNSELLRISMRTNKKISDITNGSRRFRIVRKETSKEKTENNKELLKMKLKKDLRSIPWRIPSNNKLMTATNWWSTANY